MRSFEIELTTSININSIIVIDYSQETIWGQDRSEVSQVVRYGSGSEYYYVVNLQYNDGTNAGTISAKTTEGNYPVGANAVSYSARYSTLVSKNTAIPTISGSNSNNTLLFNDGIAVIVSNNGTCLEVYDHFAQDNGKVYTDIVRNDENSVFVGYNSNTIYTTGTFHIGYAEPTVDEESEETVSAIVKYYGNIVYANSASGQVLYQTNATYISPNVNFYTDSSLANDPNPTVDNSGYFSYNSSDTSALSDHAIIFSNITLPIKPEFVIKGLSSDATITGSFTNNAGNTPELAFDDFYAASKDSNDNRIYKFSSSDKVNQSISQLAGKSISLVINSTQNKEYFYIY